MVTRLSLRSNSLAFANLSPTHFLVFPKGSFVKLPIVSQFSTPTQTINPRIAPYGPSLHKGKNPSQHQQQQQKQKQGEPHGCPHPYGLTPLLDQCKEDDSDQNDVLDEAKFTRVFDIAALRVPAKCSCALENRLRGHLLNWPRIRNIARVPGDEVEENMVSLLGDTRIGHGNEEADRGDLVTFSRRIYGKAEGDGERLSPVLYREKLANEFNSRGFVKFRNLAKISRPKRKKKNEGGSGEERNRRKSKKCAVVEVVEKEEGAVWKGLLGDDFKGSWKWKGSTRLLLLDERYAKNRVEQLPQAIKAGLHEAMKENSTSAFELVRCKLTLFYDYWQMNEILEAVLPKDMIVPSAFETIGHIAHLNLRDEHLPFKRLIAKVVLDKNKPKIQTVVNKTDAIHNDHRTMQLEVLAGNHSLVTMVVERGLRFHVDLATVYWNSRLATERQRLLNVFTPNDVVCDVFSGVGPIAISAAKVVKHVYANDLNPHAVDYLESNSVLNKLERKIKVFNMDGRRFIDAMFKSEKAHSITQVVMNLPNNAVEYLDAFRGIWAGGPKTGEFNLPLIHLYGFSKAEDPEFDFHKRIRIALREVAVDVQMHRVRLVAPGKWMLCASFRLPQSVTCANMQ